MVRVPRLNVVSSPIARTPTPPKAPEVNWISGQSRGKVARRAARVELLMFMEGRKEGFTNAIVSTYIVGQRRSLENHVGAGRFTYAGIGEWTGLVLVEKEGVGVGIRYC